jgi:hypothetical protein
MDSTDIQGQGQSPAGNEPQSSGPQGQLPAEFLEALNQKFSEYDKHLSQPKTDPTIEKLKAAFQDKPKEQDNKKWIDKHLSRLLEARQRGQEMPITEDLVVELQKQMDEMNELKRTLAEAQAALKHMKNPQTWQDNAVYSEMDNTLSGVIERVYGQSNPRMHGLVSEVIAERLKQARNEAPDVWEKIRNDKTLQRKIVMKAVSEIVPPQAMKMMREQHEANQPITPADWSAAWEEASQIEDPDVRAKAKELLRQKMFEMKSTLKAPRR